MSTLVCVKDPGALFLATDSRCVVGCVPISDTQPKIFQIAEGVYLAASGRQSACDYQTTRARELAAELGTTDVRLIAAALQRDTMPYLSALADRLRAEGVSDPMTAAHLSGAALLHGCVIAGASAGIIGYCDQSYFVYGDGLACKAQEHFLPGREITATTGGSLEALNSTLARSAAEPGFWTDPAESIARRLLAALKDSNPLSGGPDQILRLDHNGAEWICRPPASPISPELPAGAMATVTALVSLVSPSISGGSFVGSSYSVSNANGSITIDAANFLRILTGAGIAVYLDWAGFRASWLAASEEVKVDPTMFRCGPSGNPNWIAMSKTGFAGAVSGAPYISREADIAYLKPGGTTGTLTFKHGLLVNYT
jgi:hypothetical protein